MRHSNTCGLVALVAWFFFAGLAPVAVALEASVSLGKGHSMKLQPDGDHASTWPLKIQNVEAVTIKLVAVSGEQAKTCPTITHSWPKNKPGEGEILLLYKRQTDEQIIPSLGFDAGGEGAGKFKGGVVKVKGKYLAGVRAAVDRALSSKEERLLEIAFVADGQGEKQFRDSVKDIEAIKELKTLKDVKTWAKKNPKVTVIVLTVSWLPAE